MRGSRFFSAPGALAAVALLAGCGGAEEGARSVSQAARSGAACATIQSGALRSAVGETLTTGFDAWGYNYQGHSFSGGFCASHRDAAWCQPWADVRLHMSWNDAWLSNTDCDGDGLLDRHVGFETYRGSGAWLTNHEWGTYEGADGRTCRWSSFYKVVAAPADAVLRDGTWYAAGGAEIGPDVWGEFAIVQRVENDPCAGTAGSRYHSPLGAGLGRFGPRD